MSSDKVIGIRAAVAAGVSSLGARTRESVVEHFAQAQADKQAKALISGLEKLTTMERDLQKINKPDVQTFNEDGTVASATFSKERIEERKKLNEKIEKLTKAINKADESDDFGDLYNLANAG